MKLSIPVLFAALCVFFAACKKEKKTAAKSTAKLYDIWYTGSPCIGGNVNFVSSDSFSRTYLWDFGDGKASTTKAPRHIYADTGVFTVKLTIDGDTAISKSVSVHIFPVPTYTHLLSGMITWRCVRRTHNADKDTTYPSSIQSFPIIYVDPATIIVESDTLVFKSYTDDGTRYASTYQWDNMSMPDYGGHHKILTFSHTATADSIAYTTSYIYSMDWVDTYSYYAP